MAKKAKNKQQKNAKPVKWDELVDTYKEVKSVLHTSIKTHTETGTQFEDIIETTPAIKDAFTGTLKGFSTLSGELQKTVESHCSKKVNKKTGKEELFPYSGVVDSSNSDQQTLYVYLTMGYMNLLEKAQELSVNGIGTILGLIEEEVAKREGGTDFGLKETEEVAAKETEETKKGTEDGTTTKEKTTVES